MELLTKWNENHLLHCVMSYELDDRGFESRQGLEFFTSPPRTASSPALGPTQPPTHWVPGVISLGIKRPGREADRSPPSSSELKYVELYLHFPVRLHGVVLS